MGNGPSHAEPRDEEERRKWRLNDERAKGMPKHRPLAGTCNVPPIKDKKAYFERVQKEYALRTRLNQVSYYAAAEPLFSRSPRRRGAALLPPPAHTRRSTARSARSRRPLSGTPPSGTTPAAWT